MLWNDVRYAARVTRRTPIFAAAVIITTALAIGANTAVFSVVNAVMIRPFPFSEPKRIVQVAEKNDKLGLPSFGVSALNFLSWRENATSFEELAAFSFGSYTLSGVGEPEQLAGNTISADLPHLLALKPIVGRSFTPAEETPGGPAVAMIGEALWKRRFGSDKSIVGRTVTLNDTPTTIVGVAPAALNLLSGGDVYTPLIIDPPKELRLNHVQLVFGRLKPGVTLEQAQAEMNAVSAHLQQQYPELQDWGIRVMTLAETFIPPQLSSALLVLLCAVGCVLLIACANVANLLLARAAGRQKEMAVRTAIGASRSRLLRQLLVESILLAAFGGAAGILLATFLIKAVNSSLPPNLLPVPEVTLDSTVLLFAVALTAFTGLVFGLLPAWRTSRVDVNEALKVGGRDSRGVARSTVRNALAAVEIGLATVLLIGAGLLIQSFAKLQRVQLGFESRGLVTFQLSLPPAKYKTTDRAPLFYSSLLDSIRSVPGVHAAAVSSGIPFGVGNYTTSPVTTTGGSILPAGSSVPIDWRIISPGFFRAMNMPLLRGRDFTDADNANAAPVMIVSQATAKRFWGDADPIGKALHRVADPKKIAFTVVGVVGDVRSNSLNQETPTLYYPLAARATSLMDVVVRTQDAPDAVLPAIRQKVHELDSELALANVRTMDEWVSNSAAQPRLNAMVLGVFAALAMLIAVVGIYGVLAYSVNQRTQEIGVRMALGAQPRDVLRLVVAEGMRVTLIGLCGGLLGAVVLSHAISSLVYGVKIHDPATFALVSVILGVVALGACAIPARRAARVDPMVALRYE
jgi:putative ABC transport system permease protein